MILGKGLKYFGAAVSNYIVISLTKTSYWVVSGGHHEENKSFYY